MIKHLRYLDFFPYPIFRKDQEKITDQIEKSARQGNNILLVAPNGTGKTIMALSGSLPLAQDKGLKIVYLNRTHSQSSRVIEELTKIESSLSGTGKSVAGISIRGRKDMCLNNLLLKLRANPTEAMGVCADLRKNNNCVYYRNVKRLLDERNIARLIAKRIKYVLVDEYQDTNYIQDEIINKIVQQNPEHNVI